MAHTFDPGRAEVLEDVSRYQYLSRDELVAAIDPDPGDRVLDLGSGTGFYTRDVAPYAAGVCGLDRQPAMHEQHREHGVSPSVDLVTADIGSIPFGEQTFDAGFSTMTFHEFASEAALAEIARVLRPGARMVSADWSANGNGEAGPPLGDRRTAASAAALCRDAGFDVDVRSERPETFLVVATA